MGQCHSDVNSHSGSSLPPTISERTQELPRTSLSYSPPPALTPRQRNAILCKEVITTLSPPQSPDIAIRPREMPFKIKADEKNSHSRSMEKTRRPPAKSTMRLWSPSVQIDVIEIPSKLLSAETTDQIVSPPVCVAVKTDQILSPPIPFQKSPLIKNDTKKEDLVLHVAECDPKAQEDIKMIESAEESISKMTDMNETQVESMFKSTLRVMLASYLVGITCLFVVCHNTFTQQVSNAPVVGNMEVPPPASLNAKDTERKDRLHFLREMKQSIVHLGEHSMHQEMLALLSVHVVKELLTGRSECAVENIQAELEAIENDVLI